MARIIANETKGIRISSASHTILRLIAAHCGTRLQGAADRAIAGYWETHKNDLPDPTTEGRKAKC